MIDNVETLIHEIVRLLADKGYEADAVGLGRLEQDGYSKMLGRDIKRFAENLFVSGGLVLKVHCGTESDGITIKAHRRKDYEKPKMDDRGQTERNDSCSRMPGRPSGSDRDGQKSCEFLPICDHERFSG